MILDRFWTQPLIAGYFQLGIGLESRKCDHCPKKHHAAVVYLGWILVVVELN